MIRPELNIMQPLIKNTCNHTNKVHTKITFQPVIYTTHKKNTKVGKMASEVRNWEYLNSTGL